MCRYFVSHSVRLISVAILFLFLVCYVFFMHKVGLPVHSTILTNTRPIDQLLVQSPNIITQSVRPTPSIDLAVFTPSTLMRSSRIEKSGAFPLFYSSKDDPLFVQGNEERQEKKILFWTRPISDMLNEDAFRNFRCPFWKCKAFNRSSPLAVEEYDAVIFYDEDIWNTEEANRFPSKRSPHQRYVFFADQAPLPNHHFYDGMGGVFNWTMTYRWDSDVVLPYGWFTPVDQNAVSLRLNPIQLQKNVDSETTVSPLININYARNKTKMAAWFVSNCRAKNSGLNEYMQYLKEIIQIDVYGKCKNLNFCWDGDDDSCLRTLNSNYKFYIALEESLCLDYVTDKFFTAMKYHVVPVVFDLHDNYAQLAPPYSYINALNFPSVRHLADYLIKLDKNDVLYNQYFWWKKHYIVRYSEKDLKHGLCHLCSLLHGPDEPNSIYDDLKYFWVDQSQCQSIKFPSTIHKGTVEDQQRVWSAVPSDY